MPDVTVATVLFDAVDDGLDGVDLIRAHHHELLFARDEDHIFADHLAECALGQEPIGKLVEAGYLSVVRGSELVGRKEPFISVEGEMLRVVVGEVPRFRAVADDKELNETKKRPCVTVTGVVLVRDNLFHSPPRTDSEHLELDLNHGNAVDQGA